MAKGYRVTLVMAELKHSELEWYVEGVGELIEFDE